ncbi:hypothetical protein EVAR_36285_1 [Eumeta japonica]|uniref:Uncharacterized protein n=1 Tax=Eumeta variegata TaxID=151549 RepID=A0A4C1VI45_EUMVA|nr:hypothetical protein EVAR_36285_1 [Eumeta japonica]
MAGKGMLSPQSNKLLEETVDETSTRTAKESGFNNRERAGRRAARRLKGVRSTGGAPSAGSQSIPVRAHGRLHIKRALIQRVSDDAAASQRIFFDINAA